MKGYNEGGKRKKGKKGFCTEDSENRRRAQRVQRKRRSAQALLGAGLFAPQSVAARMMRANPLLIHPANGEELTGSFGRQFDSEQLSGVRQHGVPAGGHVRRGGQHALVRNHADALEPATIGHD